MSRKNEIVAAEVSERKALWAAVRRAEPIQQVRRLMRQKELLNKDLAERLGVTEAAVSRLLKGNQNIQIDTLYMLADALEEPMSIDFGNKESGVTYAFDEQSVTGFFDCTEDIGAEGTNVVQLSSYRKLSEIPLREPKELNSLALECA
ncbi:helix-turn-helix transcriptional regulator [Massilia sp. IC2-476]|uniref:helix-turn-helix domain-containing protein n=1 Tax=Massilia sp. IC2-476 TaxID=2887199 RepID=UPI001D11E7D9|nr:helix-turn-helix transcriptional regulator [Massilia sp. IC2-476]MCC2971286.1 helix-turn-helix domain-containing protein [Massilia sp. IC2-476]